MTRLFALGCLAYAVVWAWALAVLPSRVPLHFGAAGDADRWGTRTEALVTFGVLGAVVAGVFAGSVAMVRRGRVELVNVPHRDWWSATAERRSRMRELAEQDLALTGAATMVLLVLAVTGTVTAARQPEPSLPGWFFVALAGYFVVVVGWAVHAHRSRYRPVGVDG